MDLLTPAFQVAALVILVGGGAKVVAPAGFARLVSSFGMPAARPVAVVTGLLETLLGAVALVIGGRVAAVAVGAAYLVFAATVVLARRRGAADCGCFGVVSAPPSVVHVVVNVAAGAVAFGAAAAAGGPPALVDVLGEQPLLGLPYLALMAVATWLVVVVDTTGAVLVEHAGAVSALGPTFRAATSTTDTGRHRHGGRSRRAGAA